VFSTLFFQEAFDGSVASPAFFSFIAALSAAAARDDNVAVVKNEMTSTFMV